MLTAGMAALATLAAALAAPSLSAHDYAGWSDFNSRDEPALLTMGVSFKVPPGFEPSGTLLTLNDTAGKAWLRKDPGTGSETFVAFRTLYDPEGKLTGYHRDASGAWNHESLDAFWGELLTPLKGYRAHSAGMYGDRPSADASVAVAREGDPARNEELEMRMVMHGRAVLVMQCSDSSTGAVRGHEKTVEEICTPFFDSLAFEGDAASPAAGK
jgi:hypothetical protein